MEGSVATQGAAGAADAAPGTDGAEGAAGPDLNQLAGQFGEFREGQEQLRGLVTDLAAQLAPSGDGADGEAGAEGDGEIDLGFLEDATLDAAEVAQHLQGMIDTRAQQIANAAVSPLADRVTQMDRRAELQALVDDVPEMGDPKIANQVIQATAQMADAYGWPESLKSDPKMYRVVYLAAKAAEIANEEGEGGDATVATLEGGGSARAAALAQQSKDLGDSIVGARKGRSALPFG